MNANLEQVTAYVGYYESASAFKQVDKDRLFIVPMLKWKPMLMFTDILVRSKTLNKD